MIEMCVMLVNLNCKEFGLNLIVSENNLLQKNVEKVTVRTEK